jgi:hypothetical protein
MKRLPISNEPHPHYSPKLTAWQHNFPSLNEMRLVVVDESRCDVYAHAPIHFAWLDKVDMILKVKKVVVIVSGPLRRRGYPYQAIKPAVQCPCAQ